MTRRVLTLLVLAFGVLALGRPATTSGADQAGFYVIVHPDNHIDEIDRAFLRRVYLKKASKWPGGGSIRPIDLPRSVKARDRFARDVVKKSPAQLRSYWSQQVFSGKGTPPRQADSVEDVIDYVLDNKGAVGYLPADVDPGGAKVVELR